MRAHVQQPGAIAAPWPWDAARYCLELPGGAVRHFPAGTYHAQMATDAGRIELDAMETAHSAWYLFKHLSLSQYGPDELRFAAWMDAKPQPEPVPAWQQIDGLIRHLWGVSGG